MAISPTNYARMIRRAMHRVDATQESMAVAIGSTQPHISHCLSSPHEMTAEMRQRLLVGLLVHDRLGRRPRNQAEAKKCIAGMVWDLSA